MNLIEWAAKWGIPADAVAELERGLGVSTDPATVRTDTSEAGVTSRVRLEASRLGGRLWRNNVGQANDERGNYIRYGICNDSRQLNKVCKSSDLIGLRPVTITPPMVGCRIGQFVAREVKRGGWKYTGTEREQAQLTFLNLVLSLGGDAAFCNSEGTL